MIELGDLVSTDNLQHDVILLTRPLWTGESLQKFGNGNGIAFLRSGRIGLVVDKLGNDVRVLSDEGVGWTWRGNLARIHR